MWQPRKTESDFFSKIAEQVSVPDGLNVTVSVVASAVSTHF